MLTTLSLATVGQNHLTQSLVYNKGLNSAVIVFLFRLVCLYFMYSVFAAFKVYLL